jgi:transketolase
MERKDVTTDLRARAKLRLLQMHYESSVGHIGGNLSALDLLLCLYHTIMSSEDMFILSKGHAAGALYVTLWTLGSLTDADLDTFHQDATLLSGHPPSHGIEEILFATGSLGHGLSLAAGLALGKKLKNEAGRVFCLTSDGEWNEGSSWEALIFAHQRGLDNLTYIVDANGFQGFGTTAEVADLHPLRDKFAAFGAACAEIDGHEPDEIRRALRDSSGAPQAVVAHTKKGCGVSFMENRMEWHYRPLTEVEYHQALEEVSEGCAMPSAVAS